MSRLIYSLLGAAIGSGITYALLKGNSSEPDAVDNSDTDSVDLESEDFQPLAAKTEELIEDIEERNNQMGEEIAAMEVALDDLDEEVVKQ